MLVTKILKKSARHISDNNQLKQLTLFNQHDIETIPDTRSAKRN